MWNRFRRLIRSFVGFFISSMEDPKLILEQTVRDMQDKVPVMNQGLAKAKGGIIMLQNEQRDYEQEVSLLTAKIKACIANNQESLAQQFVLRLKKCQEALTRDKQQLEAAKVGYESLLQLKERFMQEMKAKTEAAMSAIKEAEASKWKGELADVFEKFEVAGVDATYDEMISKVRQKSAEAEGRIAMAAESIDMKSIQIDKQAEDLQAKELLKQFQMEMGLGDNSSVSKEEMKKTIGMKQPDQAK